VFVVDGKIHVVAGRLRENPSMVGLHDVYDPVTDRWTPAPPLPTPRSSLAFAEHRGLLIVAGGECRTDGKTFDQVEAYNPTTKSWRTLPPLPMGRHAFAAATAAGKLFFIGGSTECGGDGKTAEVLVLTLR
jgi:hypothetical protein